ncbi:hypothetical protein DM02DRAFT_647564 [Periconia macrospinosa]|uniref:HTH CENPB-type domain-containing protein n=1 Tax=Periconia macrospinosa TaxID=97972 RepID=A0A2V1CZC1_9PLEO|nr:hypothetical protein DM02DRAFT_647564 [Periconia macrospinosa]
MTDIIEALAECDSIPSGKKISHRRETRSREEVSASQRNLQPQQEAELTKHIKRLTEQKLPPTREMVQNYASDIAGHPVSESRVTRFLNQHPNELKSHRITSMDRQRHRANSLAKYESYLGLLEETIEKCSILPYNIYNMDEKGFLIGVEGRSKRVFDKASWDAKEVRTPLQDGIKSFVTLLASTCAAATGEALPPTIIYEAAGKDVQASWVAGITMKHHSYRGEFG